MNELSKVEFAAHLGKQPSYVTKLAKDGRLVMSADGKRVNVEASERMIAATTGNRLDVADRHAAARGAKKTTGMAADINHQEKTQQRPTAQADVAEKIGSSMQAARAVKEKYAAMRAKTEYEMLVGDLIPMEDNDATLRYIGAAVRSAMEVFPDQITPMVAPIGDMAEVHEILTEACTDVLRRVSEEILKHKTEKASA